MDRYSSDRYSSDRSWHGPVWSSSEESDFRWGGGQPSPHTNATDFSATEGEFAPPEIKAEFSRSLSLRIPRSDNSASQEGPLAASPPSPSTLESLPPHGDKLRQSLSLRRGLWGKEANEASISPSKLSRQTHAGPFSFPANSVSPTSSPGFGVHPLSPTNSPGGLAVPSPAATSPATRISLSPLGPGGPQSTPPNANRTSRTLFERRAGNGQGGIPLTSKQGKVGLQETERVHRSSILPGEVSKSIDDKESRLAGVDLAERPVVAAAGGWEQPVADSHLPPLPETSVPPASPGGDPKTRDVVYSTNEEVFHNLVQSKAEPPSPPGGWGDGPVWSASTPVTSGTFRILPEPITPASTSSEPPMGGVSRAENTPPSAMPGHQRKLSLSNSAPMMVTQTSMEGTSVDSRRSRLVKRSNSTLESRALQRSRQDAVLRSILRNSTVIGKDYTIKVDVSAAHLPRFSSFDLSDPGSDEDNSSGGEPDHPSKLTDYSESGTVIPPLTIAILIVGTRGDVQPFIAIGKRLLAYGHRVRLATHANYRSFVTEQGLEFFPLGGDPKILAEYMVKNKGFLPSWPSEVKEQRKQLKSIIFSSWDACTSPDWESNGKNFIAEAIIANPPAYGHIHVAERLKIPLHLIFTMPWSPTGAFPHPLARLTQYAGFENRLSYAIVDSITWLGVRDIINSFRTKKLKLSPISLTDRWSSAMLQTNKVPFAYIWSPSLVPKPKDWGSYIDVVGFCFLDLANAYKPPEDLEAFLKEGPPPVFIGFGSLPVGDPQKMTAIIFEALRKTGMRGIVQKGWGGLGEGIPNPPSVYIVGNCPHDWLFPQCAAVVHHGGAGTTAAGLLAECPTTVVPFFGDQPFWGDAVSTQGVGPKAIPVGDFSLDRLVKALEFMARPEVKEAAIILANKMRLENGVEGAVHAFHKHLPKDVKNGRKMLWGLTRKRAARAKRQPGCGCFG